MFNNDDPIRIGDFADLVTRCGHQLVIPFSLISELIPADNNPITVLRRFTKIEEDVPHVFFQQRGLPDHELRQAASEFAHGQPFTPHDPFVASFHELWGDEFRNDPIFLMDVDRTIGMRKMSTQIELLLQRPEVYHWSGAEAARAVYILEQEQIAIIKDTGKAAFQNTTSRWLRRAGIHMTDPQMSSFAVTLRRSPGVSPGWRLFVEVFDQLVRNKAYRPVVNDVWDLAHVAMLPYVGAATLDKGKVELVRQATQRLRIHDPSCNYDSRTFSSIADFIEALAK